MAAVRLVKQGGPALADIGSLVSELARVGTLVTADRQDVSHATEDLVSNPRGVRQRASPSAFTLHIGSTLRISGVENLSKVPKQASKEPASEALHDPFQGLPLHGLAEYLGDRVMPALEAAKKEHKHLKQEAAMYHEVVTPYIPPLLPITRWASQDAKFRSTLVVDDARPKKARLSWYHPDDTMVPRDWFSGGLLEDLKYYSPFGLFSSSSSSSTTTTRETSEEQSHT